MAGNVKHEETLTEDATNTDNVATIVTPDNSSEILLYVEDGNQGVQDLIRVAISQSLTPGELQQQLHDAGASITLQNFGGEAHSIISMQQDGVTECVEGQLITEQEACQVVQSKQEGDMNNLFQLANLSGVLSSESERKLNESMVKIEEEQKEDIDNPNEISCSDGVVIEDYVIANIDSKETGKLPGEFNVGDSFYSLEEVEEALRLYEEKHSVKLYKRDVRSLEALLKRSLKLQKLEKINESLKYGQLLYCCVYGGKRKAQKIACMDESGVARYTDCKMFIRFAISDDGMKLVVNGKLETHCHDEVVSDQENVEPLYITNTGNADEIRLGAGFVDLEELYKAIHKYETDNHVHLWRRDGRTVEALAKRAPGTAKKIMDTNPGLRFAELRFCCSFGGRHLSEDKKRKNAKF